MQFSSDRRLSDDSLVPQVGDTNESLALPSGLIRENANMTIKKYDNDVLAVPISDGSGKVRTLA